MWNYILPASHSQTATMTNNEILQSDLLDILFEHRNKTYGAYALRRQYGRRLLTALCVAISVIVLFALLRGGGQRSSLTGTIAKNDTVWVIPIEESVPPAKPAPPPKQAVKLPEPTARVKFTVPVIKPDIEVPSTEMPDKNAITENEIGTEDGKGKEPTGIVGPVSTPLPPGKEDKADEEKPLPAFIPEEKDPEFPGGPEALRRYLSRHLDTPGELNPGEKKMVRIRFWVGKDGSISALEIEQSGGDIFDKEVVRVCKKMPRWKPAIQNGVTVPVSYLLPVTFIGSEQ